MAIKIASKNGNPVVNKPYKRIAPKEILPFLVTWIGLPPSHVMLV